MKNGNGSSGTPLAPELTARLRALEHRVSPSEISDLWVFPPLADLEDSREFVLFTRLLPDEMRRVCAAEFPDRREGAGTGNGDGSGAAPAGNGARHAVAGGNGTGNGNGNGSPARGTAAVARITEYGRVPSTRVHRVVDGFRRRLGDDREPLHLRIEGRPESWERLLAPELPEG